MRLLLYKHKSVMKRILFMIILGLGGLMPVNRTLAQRAVDLFQDYSWEQASLHPPIHFPLHINWSVSPA